MRKGTAVGYARRSKKEEGNTASVDRQQKDIEALAERLGVEVEKVYVDNGVSGWKKRSENTGWAQMLADLKDDPPEYVLVWKSDRLSRRLGDVELIDDIRKAAGLQLWSTVEGDVFRGPWPIIMGIAKWSSEETSMRVRRAQDDRRAQGLPVNGGKRPFGYTADRLRLVQHEVDTLHEIADRLIGGETLTGISRDLNKRGIPTATGGGNWNSTTLSRILRNPRYIGQMAKGRTEAIGEAAWPRVFDDATWDALQAVLTDTHMTGHGNPTGKSLLGGLARCGRCLSKMTSSNTLYRCNKNAGGCGRVSRSKRLLDDYVVSYMLDHYSTEVISDRRERADDAVKVANHDHNEALNRLADLEAAYEQGKIDAARYWPMYDRARQRARTSREALAEARANQKQAGSDRLAHELWAKWSPEEQRHWMKQRVATVIVQPSGKGSLGHRIDPAKVRIDLR